MRIRSRPTPNPDSLMFEVKGAALIPSGLLAFHSAREAEADTLGSALFEIEGVETLLIVPNFVTVTKHPTADWTPLSKSIEQTLRVHLG